MDNEELKKLFRPVSNIRELGGIRAADGKRIRHGIFYRGSAPGELNAEELEAVRSLGLRLIIDLRSEYEIRENPDPEINGARIRQISALSEGDEKEFPFLHLRSEIEYLTKENHSYRDGMKYAYLNMLCGSRAFSILFDEILAGNVPVLFHCAAGKDRTGMASILILLALGADMQDALKDYLMTNAYRESLVREDLEFFREFAEEDDMSRGAVMGLRGVDPSTADMIRDVIMRTGGPEVYLEKAYRLNSEKLNLLRQMYLE